MPPDSAATWGAVIKCTAGLAIVTLIAATGAGGAEGAGDGTSPVRGASSASHSAHAAEHRKSLFDERRTRIDGAHERHTAISSRYAEAGDAAR
jgi:hypothetical protein